MAAIIQTDPGTFSLGSDRALCPGCNQDHGDYIHVGGSVWMCRLCNHTQSADAMVSLRDLALVKQPGQSRQSQIESLAINIRRELIGLRGDFKRAVSHIEAAGKFLNDAKRLFKHGEWLAWLDENFAMSEETATNFRHVASFHEKHPDIDLSEFAPTILYKITAPSVLPDAVQEILKLLTGGEKVSVGRAKSIIDQETVKSAPPIIRAAVEADELTVKAGAAITRALDKAPQVVKEVIQKFGVSDPAMIPALSGMAKRGSETFKVIAITGALQGGGEAVPLARATVRDLEALLSENRHYKMVGDAPDYLVDASCKVVAADAGRITLDASIEAIEQLQKLLSQNPGVLCRITVRAAKEPIMNQTPKVQS